MLWINTEARKSCACSRCGAKPTEPCRYPSGRKYRDIHAKRLLAYRKSISPEEFDRRHKIKLANQLETVLSFVRQLPD